ncbi:oogenesis-related [Electrophorus electricus]|uniref:Oogenesis-related gene n=1 Tax=Electrophorus electricus TaxID=8005 RepID=A0A4W4FKC7_ELEEL|nr:oogenesis-related [Electrophorus electricus]XP_026873915.2 oogenesis-related [Electrophorus electricus]
MTFQCVCNVDPENVEGEERKTVTRGGVFASVLCRISQFWPISFVMRGVRGLWCLFGFSSPSRALSSPAATERSSPSVRQCRIGRKRLRWFTRVLLAVLPRRVQGVFGYPVCASIGCSVSPEVRCSPTKPCGKGSKRKQDDMDDDDEEEEQLSWVEVLTTQNLADEDHSADPDYEVSEVDTDSEEYQSHNETESDLEVEKGVVVIKDLETGIPSQA